MEHIIAQPEASVEFLTNVLGHDHAETLDAIDQLARVRALA